MPDLIKIGVKDMYFSYSQAMALRQALVEMGLDASIDLIKNQAFDNVHWILQSLGNSDYDIVVHPLSDIPFGKFDSMVIAGLSKRILPGDCIVCTKNTLDLSQDLKIKPKGRLLVEYPLQKEQLHSLRDDLSIEIRPMPIENKIKSIKEENYDGILLPQSQAKIIQEQWTDFEIIHLHPKEVIPIAGSGVCAYLVHPENFEIRKICQKIHHKETAEATNIERKIAQLFGDTPNHSYTYKDQNQNYHVVACSFTHEFKKISISRSTSFNLSSEVYQALHSKLSK